MRSSRKILLAGVSSLVLTVFASSAGATDLPVKAPPPMPAPAASPWTWWIEGGGQAVLGDPYVPGLSPAFDAKPSNWGWDVAGGFDYRFDAMWHLSADFRYGANQRNLNSVQLGCIITNGSACGTLMHGANSATRKEYNWAADFMVGRDVGLGLGTSQIKGGLRVAQIRGTTTGQVNWAITSAAVTIGPSVYSQTNKFTGVGPRVALEGNAPVGGAWSIDYMVGAAGLYAWRSTSQTAFTPIASGGFACFTGCPINASTSSSGFVFNPDAMIGVAYAISPTTKIALNYHVDAYFNAFRAFGAGGLPLPALGSPAVASPGSPTYVNRIYHGPSLRLTMQY